MKYIPLALISFAVATTAFAKAPAVALPNDTSFKLTGVVDDDGSKPFACMLGTFKVKVQGKRGNQVQAIIEGKGILMNSGYLHTNVSENPDITYFFPENAKIENGTKLTLFCNENGEPGKAEISYYVPHQN